MFFDPYEPTSRDDSSEHKVLYESESREERLANSAKSNMHATACALYLTNGLFPALSWWIHLGIEFEILTFIKSVAAWTMWSMLLIVCVGVLSGIRKQSQATTVLCITNFLLGSYPFATSGDFGVISITVIFGNLICFPIFKHNDSDSKNIIYLIYANILTVLAAFSYIIIIGFGGTLTIRIPNF